MGLYSNQARPQFYSFISNSCFCFLLLLNQRLLWWFSNEIEVATRGYIWCILKNLSVVEWMFTVLHHRYAAQVTKHMKTSYRPHAFVHFFSDGTTVIRKHHLKSGLIHPSVHPYFSSSVLSRVRIRGIG